jgi:carboxypeptidase PM20D1
MTRVVGIVAAAVAAIESRPMPAALDGPAALLFDRLGPEMPFWSRLPLANRWLLGRLIVAELEKKSTTNAILRTTTAATIFEWASRITCCPPMPGTSSTSGSSSPATPLTTCSPTSPGS